MADSFDNLEETGLDGRYTFSRFVAGSSNRVATALAQHVAEQPGQSGYNPLVIYTGYGLGKEKLLQAIGNGFLGRYPQQKVKYLTVEEFCDQLSHALSENRLSEFRSSYQNLNLLILDDFQQLQNNKTAQSEILNIFTALIEAKRQLVIGSDRPPRAMRLAEAGLKELLQAAAVADLQLPDYEMRLATLKAKSVFLPIKVSNEVLELIAHKYNQGTLAELENILTRVVDFALNKAAPLSVEIASEALNNLFVNVRKILVTSDRIIEQVAVFYNFKVEDLLAANRDQEVSLARQIAIYIAREHTEMTLAQIGQVFGKLTPAAIKYAHNKIEAELENNPSLRQQVNTIVPLLYAHNAA